MSKEQELKEALEDKQLPTVQRPCMKCGVPFQSEGFSNRHCGKCNTLNASYGRIIFAELPKGKKKKD